MSNLTDEEEAKVARLKAEAEKDLKMWRAAYEEDHLPSSNWPEAISWSVPCICILAYCSLKLILDCAEVTP